MCVFRTYKGYEEVCVPAPPCAPPPGPDELVKISELDDWVQVRTAFSMLSLLSCAIAA
jgi:hypothetical protein